MDGSERQPETWQREKAWDQTSQKYGVMGSCLYGSFMAFFAGADIGSLFSEENCPAERDDTGSLRYLFFRQKTGQYSLGSNIYG